MSLKRLHPGKRMSQGVLRGNTRLSGRSGGRQDRRRRGRRADGGNSRPDRRPAGGSRHRQDPDHDGDHLSRGYLDFREMNPNGTNGWSRAKPRPAPRSKPSWSRRNTRWKSPWSRRPDLKASEQLCPTLCPVQRIVLVPAIAQRLETHGGEIEQRQASDHRRPKPTISRITSSAISEPTMPVSAPSTPASAQVAAAPGGGFCGNRQR